MATKMISHSVVVNFFCCAVCSSTEGFIGQFYGIDGTTSTRFLFHLALRDNGHRQCQHKTGAVLDQIIEAQVAAHAPAETPTKRQTQANTGSAVRGLLGRFAERAEKPARACAGDPLT